MSSCLHSLQPDLHPIIALTSPVSGHQDSHVSKPNDTFMHLTESWRVCHYWSLSTLLDPGLHGFKSTAHCVFSHHWLSSSGSLPSPLWARLSSNHSVLSVVNKTNMSVMYKKSPNHSPEHRKHTSSPHTYSLTCCTYDHLRLCDLPP